MRDYEMILEIRPGEGGMIPPDVREKIAEALNPLTDGGIAEKNFSGEDGSLEYQFSHQIGGGDPVEDYAAELAAAVRSIPGCEKESGIEMQLGYCQPVYEYDWIEDL